MHVAIAGNIGSGKTTLTNLLSKHYNWDTHFEDVDQNPYLNDFYHDMQRWSFNLQIYYPNIVTGKTDRKSTRLNSSHSRASRMPSSA